MGCLRSLRRTLGVAEGVWSRAETLLQEYAMERAAITARHRQILADLETLKAQQRSSASSVVRGRTLMGNIPGSG